MTTDEAKALLEDIKSYEHTLYLIMEHSVSVQDACAIGISAIEEVERYKKAIGELRAEISRMSEKSTIVDISAIYYRERTPKEIKEEVLSILDKYFKE